MTTTVPPEPPSVAPACPACGKELPPGAGKCPACAPRTKVCPVCGNNEMPLRARKCLVCGEYLNWKGRWTSATAIVTFVVTTMAAVIGSVATWQKLRPEPQPPTPVSHTEIASFDYKERTRLTVNVSNSGKKESRVLRDFTMYIDEPDVIEFGPLALLSPGKAVPLEQTVTLELEIVYIRPRFNVLEDDFWTRHGAKTLTLAGTVVESDGIRREMKQTMQLRDLHDFVRARSDPPPRSGTS